MKGAWYNGLRVQTVLLLTLALIPLGAVAIYQTDRVSQEAEENAELALLALTGREAKAEELMIANAFGAARFFATVAADFADDPERCSADLGRFVDQNERYSFIGIIPSSGLMTCSSSGQTFDLSGFPDFKAWMEKQERTIVASASAPLSRQSVFNLSEPFEIDGAFAGYISISIPYSRLPGTSGELAERGLEDLIMFNRDGEILTSRNDKDRSHEALPAGRALEDLQLSGAAAFHDINRRGERRTYTVVPIEGTPATVIGVWYAENPLFHGIGNIIRPTVFPVLMWFASMGVAMLSIYMLVLRHIARLRGAMNRFARDRRIGEPANALSMPNELRELNDHFEQMTGNILQDEAILEDALREKNVLIKEVHHRVKNNLQLISSIMNMQIRTAEHDETRSVLLRLQDRVLSLARIHRDLYQSQNGGRIDAGTLISDLVENSIEVASPNDGAVAVDTDIDAVLLFPDQAVPLSLMVAEGVTNALKYLGAPPGQTPWISASLKQAGLDCVLTLANSIGAPTSAETTGLGAQLIDAFAIQLGGKVETDETSDRYEMTVRFTIQEFTPEIRDF